jgi:uncharacterized protein YjbJ (UPF0337 family)
MNDPHAHHDALEFPDGQIVKVMRLVAGQTATVLQLPASSSPQRRGKVQEGVGRATGDVKTKTEGVMNQAAGAAQDLYGQTADVARQTATTLDDWLRNTIETRPYTSAIVALGIGSAR